MNATVRIGKRVIGDGHPVYVIAEIGINHNASVETAKKLIDGARFAGANAVKFQKRTPELCVPRDQWDIERETPWGRMRYIDYRRRMEFGEFQYAEIDAHCRERQMTWFASCWDEESVEFMERFEPPCYKIASASITDLPLVKKLRATGRPLIMSTGMSTFQEVESAVETVGTRALLIAHCTSSYPCPLSEINLNMIKTLKGAWPQCPIGYSGHEAGLAPSWAAVAMGATFIERHITLDRAMWGTDQAASIEVSGFARLVSNIRDIEQCMGDGVKRVEAGELSVRRKLRRARPERDGQHAQLHIERL